MPKGKQSENLKKGKATEYRAGGEQAETARKGGIASGVARREKKALRDTMEAILSLSLKQGEIDSIDGISSLAETNGKNISVQEAIVIAQVAKALKGDVKSAKLVMDYLAEMQDKNEEGGITIVDDL